MNQPESERPALFVEATLIDGRGSSEMDVYVVLMMLSCLAFPSAVLLGEKKTDIVVGEISSGQSCVTLFG